MDESVRAHRLTAGNPTSADIAVESADLQILVGAVEALAGAVAPEDVGRIVRVAARRLTGADGIAVILLKGDRVLYLDEDAIGPLWKGSEFPVDSCVSGWAIKHRQRVVIEDIFADERVPIELYKPTFVKSLVMVPVGADNPTAAIGAYWAVRRRPEPREISALDAIARATAVALENIRLIEEMRAANEQLSLLAGELRDREADRRDNDLRMGELQSKLFHVSRLSEMGQMASALAHELNQPLQAIGSYIAGVRRLLEKGETAKVAEAAAKAAQQVDRAGAIIRRLREFVRRGETERRPEALAKVVEEAAALALLGARSLAIRVEVHIDAEASIALIDKVQIQQVLVNLARNAVEAMAASDRRELTFIALRRSDDMIEVQVRDTGPGIAEDVKERLFQPFVTSKTSGVGVGLSISRAIIESHRGQIWVEDNNGGGTVFKFTVPAG
jgi:C4-dicarboxylate-specific signal transduction histidine kinase